MQTSLLFHFFFGSYTIYFVVLIDIFLVSSILVQCTHTFVTSFVCTPVYVEKYKCHCCGFKTLILHLKGRIKTTDIWYTFDTNFRALDSCFWLKYLSYDLIFCSDHYHHVKTRRSRKVIKKPLSMKAKRGHFICSVFYLDWKFSPQIRKIDFNENLKVYFLSSCNSIFA